MHWPDQSRPSIFSRCEKFDTHRAVVLAEDCRSTAVTPHAKGEKQCKLIRGAIVDGAFSRDDLKRQVCCRRQDNFRQVHLHTAPIVRQARQRQFAPLDTRLREQSVDVIAALDVGEHVDPSGHLVVAVKNRIDQVRKIAQLHRERFRLRTLVRNSGIIFLVKRVMVISPVVCGAIRQPPRLCEPPCSEKQAGIGPISQKPELLTMGRTYNGEWDGSRTEPLPWAAIGSHG